MAVAFVRSHTAVSIKTAGTNNLGVNISTVTDVGNVLVARILFDNAATASKPVVSSIAVAAGETNTWARLGATYSTSTTAGAFASGEMWAILTSVPWPVASYTVTFDVSTVMKATLVQEFSGVLATLRNTPASAYSTTTTGPTVTTSGTTPVSGDLALGFVFGSNVAVIQTGCSDTVGGTWSAAVGLGSTGGSTATNNFGLAQYKVYNTSAQVFYSSGSFMSAGNGAMVALLRQYVDPSITQAAYRFYADGTETASTALAAQDTTHTVDLDSGDVNLQLRVRLQSTTAVAVDSTDDFQLQYEKNASGTWISPSSGVLASYDTTYNNTQGLYKNNTQTGDGQSFTASASAPVLSVGFRLSKNVSPTGNAVAKLYAHSGTFGTSSVPTGAALAVSEPVDVATIVNNVLRVFTFTGANIYTVTQGVKYCAVIEYTPAGSGSFDGIGVRGVLTGSSHEGNEMTLTSSAWVSTAAADAIFYVYSSPSTDVAPYNSPNLTDAAATTNRLTGGTGTFTAGKVSEDGLAEDVGWAGNAYTELLYSLTLKQADLANADTIRFRILRNGVTTGLTYTQTPTVAITKTPLAITQAAYQFYADGTETGATALAAQNTAPTVDLDSGDVNLQLRVRLQSTTVVAVDSTDDFQLQYEKNASGTWNSIAPPLSYVTATSPTTTSKSALEHGYGQSFLGNGSPLLGLRMMLARGSGATGTLTASLYAHTGTYGASGATGTGSPLATSDTLITESVTSVQPTYQWVEFTFDGSFTLQQDVPYVIRYRVLSISGLVYVRYDAVRVLSGSMQYYSGSLWSAYTAYTALFDVITAAPITVAPYGSTDLTDGAATTNRLTGGTGTFTAGKVSEDGLVDDLGWTGNNYTELLYAITLKQADLAGDNTLKFRILRNGVTTGLTYTETPAITTSTVVGGPSDYPLAGTVAGTTATTGSPAATYPLTGVTAATTTTSGAIGLVSGAQAYPLAGTVAGTTTTTGIPAATHPLTSTLTATSTVTGAPAASYPLAGAVSGVSTTAGVIGLVVGAQDYPLAGTLTATTTVTGTPAATHPLAGPATTSTTTTTGTPAAVHPLTGALAATSATTGTLVGVHPVTGTLIATSTAVGSPTAIHPLTGTADGLTASSGTINFLAGPQQYPLAGNLPAISTVATATLRSRLALVGTVTGTTTTVGNLAVLGGRPRVWDGSAWVTRPVKVWNGSAWVERPMRHWTGSAWELV